MGAAASFPRLDFLCEISPDGAFRAVAGNGAWGLAGDGGLATGAECAHAGALTLDSAGDLFIVDGGNNRIRKVTPDGIITTVAGSGPIPPPGGSPGSFSGDGGPATSAQLASPQGAAVDAVGNLVIADTGNNRIRKVSPDGIITTIAGNGAQGYSGDGGPAIRAALWPFALAVDGAGNVYVSDPVNNVIRVLRPVPTRGRLPRR